MSVIGMLNNAVKATGPLSAAASGNPWMAAIGPALDFASNLFGGNGSNFKGMRSQLDLQREFQYNAWQDELPQRMAGAKKAGIHPLAALGMQGTPVQWSATGSPSSSPWSNMGQDISRAVGAYMSADDKKMVQAGAMLDLENKQLQNDYIRNQIRLMTAAGTANGPENAVLSGTGQPSKLIPRTIQVVDKDGTIVDVLNPDIGDNEFMMGHDWLMRTLPQEFNNAFARTRDELLDWFAGRKRPRAFVRKDKRSYTRTRREYN